MSNAWKARLDGALRGGEVAGLYFTTALLIVVEFCFVCWLNRNPILDVPTVGSGFIVLPPWYRKPRFVEERVAARDEAVGQRARKLEDGVRGEAVVKIRDHFAVVLANDANGVEVFLHDEVNAAHGVGEAADGQRRAECQRSTSARSESAEDAAFFGLAAEPRGTFCQGAFRHNKYVPQDRAS